MGEIFGFISANDLYSNMSVETRDWFSLLVQIDIVSVEVPILTQIEGVFESFSMVKWRPLETSA